MKEKHSIQSRRSVFSKPQTYNANNMHLLFIIIYEYKKPIIAAIISIIAAATDEIMVIDTTYQQIDFWIGIFTKLVAGVAGIYSINEVRRKRKAAAAAIAAKRSGDQRQGRSTPDHKADNEEKDVSPKPKA